MKKLTLLLLLPWLATGCSRMALSNNSLDYQQARSLPPLVVPAGTTLRPQSPLYPVPEVQEPSANAPQLSNARGNRYVLPTPLPLDAAQLSAQAQLDTGTPSRPVLVVDGNGFPLLRTEGSAVRIWTLLQQALTAAKIQTGTVDQNRGVIAVAQTQTPVNLRLDRSGNTTLITVQTADNRLADAAVATDLLNQIAGHWPQ